MAGRIGQRWHIFQLVRSVIANNRCAAAFFTSLAGVVDAVKKCTQPALRELILVLLRHTLYRKTLHQRSEFLLRAR